MGMVTETGNFAYVLMAQEAEMGQEAGKATRFKATPETYFFQLVSNS